MKNFVLIVEDEEDIRELVSYHLLKEGYQVASVASGEEALTLAETQTPDLILLDVMLPGMDGLTVCQRLRASPKTADVADHDAHGQERGGRHHSRAEPRGDRLRHQALQSQGVAGPRASGASPQAAAATSGRGRSRSATRSSKCTAW